MGTWGVDTATEIEWGRKLSSEDDRYAAVVHAAAGGMGQLLVQVSADRFEG